MAGYFDEPKTDVDWYDVGLADGLFGLPLDPRQRPGHGTRDRELYDRGRADGERGRFEEDRRRQAAADRGMPYDDTIPF